MLKKLLLAAVLIPRLYFMSEGIIEELDVSITTSQDLTMTMDYDNKLILVLETMNTERV
jgi:hypothetical protein